MKRLLRLARECVDQAGGGALRGGGGIVELMGQVAGQLAQGGELFSLLLDARDFADAVEQRGNDALGHGGNGLKHLREERSWWMSSAQSGEMANPWPP